MKIYTFCKWTKLTRPDWGWPKRDLIGLGMTEFWTWKWLKIAPKWLRDDYNRMQNDEIWLRTDLNWPAQILFGSPGVRRVSKSMQKYRFGSNSVNRTTTWPSGTGPGPPGDPGRLFHFYWGWPRKRDKAMWKVLKVSMKWTLSADFRRYSTLLLLFSVSAYASMI